jgi:pSer/pThr/pTyr-binding forkhead associated (FHA) protein
MARLVVKKNGMDERVIELKLGLNRIGRTQDNDFQIEHPTISSRHCELRLEGNEIVVRDCGSTNGTSFLGQPIQEIRLQAGQTFAAGDIEFFIESTEANVAIPKFDRPVEKAPPVVTKDGMLCSRHPRATVTHRCAHCREVMCEACVTKLRRRGGKVLKLCPVCSHHVELIGAEKKKKKGFLGLLQKTMKLPLIRAGTREE